MQKKKKKKRFGYYLYAFVALMLAIANVAIALYLLTYVQDISVSGNQYSQQVMIKQWIQEDKYTANSVYAVLKFKLSDQELPSYLEEASVGWNSPWELSVEVKEKEVVGGILEKGIYIYFSEDGTILKKSSDMLDGIPVVEGVEVKSSALFKEIVVENEKVYASVVEVSKVIRRNKLSPDRIVWENDGMSVYFGEVKVLIGRINYHEKLVQVPPILEKLGDKKGILHLEHYNDEISTSISFTENVE